MDAIIRHRMGLHVIKIHFSMTCRQPRSIRVQNNLYISERHAIGKASMVESARKNAEARANAAQSEAGSITQELETVGERLAASENEVMQLSRPPTKLCTRYSPPHTFSFLLINSRSFLHLENVIHDLSHDQWSSRLSPNICLAWGSRFQKSPAQ